MHSKLLLSFILFLTPISLWAQESTPQVFRFLNSPSSAQAMAVGGLSITYVDGFDGQAFDNPALYGEEATGRLSLGYLNYMWGSHAALAMYGRSWKERGAWAVGIRAMNYGKLKGYNHVGREENNFSATDLALEALYSYELSNKLRGGIAFKLLYGNIERYNSFALASDIGVSYYNGENGLSLGATLANVGAVLKGFDDRKFLTPWDLRLGYSQRFAHAPFRIHTTLYDLNPFILRDQKVQDRKLPAQILRHIIIGGEFFLGDRFWLGLGYNARMAQDLTIQGGNLFSGTSMGIGFNSHAWRLGLSVSRYHPAALSFMITLCTDFGNDQYRF